MKKLFFLFCFLAFFFNSFSQKQPFQRSVPGYPVKDSRLYVTENLAIPKASDTTSALKSGPDSLGLVVQMLASGDWYKRDSTPGGHKWTKVGLSFGYNDIAASGYRSFDYGGNYFRMFSKNASGVWTVSGSALNAGDSAFFQLFGTVALMGARDGMGGFGVIAIDPTLIAFGQSSGNYQFSYMNSSSDIANKLPVGMDATGHIFRMNAWSSTSLSSFNLTAGRGVYATGTGLANAKFIMDTTGTSLRLDDGYNFISSNGSQIFGLANTGASYSSTPSPFTKSYLSGLIFYPTAGGTEMGIGSSTLRGGYNDLITGKGHSSYVGTGPDSLVITVMIPQSGTQGPKIRMDSASLAITHIQTEATPVSGDSALVDHSGKIYKTPMESGVYTPTVTGVLNFSAGTGGLTRWIRVGNVVVLNGLITLTATTGASLVIGNITAPVSSNFTAADDASGIISCSTCGSSPYTGVIQSNNGFTTLNFSVTPPNTTARTLNFTATYIVH